MPHIVEVIITSQNAKQEPYAAPFGIRQVGSITQAGGIRRAGSPQVRFAPFYPSKTLENLAHNPLMVVNYTTCPMAFVACLVNARHLIGYEPLGEVLGETLGEALEEPLKQKGLVRLENCHRWAVIKCHIHKQHSTRPEVLGEVIAEQKQVKEFGGYNRSLGAIIEAAVAVTRLHILAPQQVKAAFENAEVIVGKTADETHQRAFELLADHYRQKLKQQETK